MKSTLVRVGDFLFKWRNLVFPALILAVMLAVPPSNSFLGRQDLEPLRDVLAIFVMLAGLVLRSAVIGFVYIKRGGRKKKVYAADLVTTGMFGVCRNPLYVGNLLIYAGIGIMHGNPWVLGGGLLLFAFMYQAIVLAEEHFLKDKFGDAYLAYCADVPRWGLRWSRFREATAGMRFDLGKALLVDYNPILNAVFILSAIELYERFTYPPRERDGAIWWLISLMVLALVASGLVHYYKRHWRVAAPRQA